MPQHVYEQEVEVAINKLLELINAGSECGAFPKKIWLNFSGDEDTTDTEDTNALPCGEDEIDELYTILYATCDAGKSDNDDDDDNASDEIFTLTVPDGTEEGIPAVGLIIDQVESYEYPGCRDMNPGNKPNWKPPFKVGYDFEGWFGFLNPWDIFEVETKRTGEEDFTVRGAVHRGVDGGHLDPILNVDDGMSGVLEFRDFLQDCFNLSSILAVLRPGDEVRFRLKYRNGNPYEIDCSGWNDKEADDWQQKSKIGIALNLIMVVPLESVPTVPTSVETVGWFMGW